MISNFRDNKNRLIVVILFFLAIVPSCLAFYHWAFSGHDMLFHMVRIQGIADGLKTGQFPVRMNTIFLDGYGYPNSILYGELFLYIPAILFLCGFSIVKAYNTYIVLVNFATVFIAYYSFKRMFKSREIGVFATAIYAWAPYRFINLYVRSAVGEYTAMVFFPLIIYGLYRLYVDDKDRFSFLPLAFGITGVIQSHMISVEMVGMIMFVVLLLFVKKTVKIVVDLVKALLTIIFLNLWFIVPFLQYFFTQTMGLSTMEWADVFYNSGSNILQLFMLFITYGYENGGPEDGIRDEVPFTPGFGMIVCLFVCLGVLLYNKEKIAKSTKLAFISCFVLGGLTVWMGTLKFPWPTIFKLIPITRKICTPIQYSWRFYSIASVLIAAAIGFAIIILNSNCSQTMSRIVMTSLCLLNMISILSYIPECVNNQNQYLMDDVSSIDTIGASMGAEYLPVEADKYYIAAHTELMVEDNISVESYTKIGASVKMVLRETSHGEGIVTIPLIMYDEYDVNDSEGIINRRDLRAGEFRQMELTIPADYSGSISIYYKVPWYWRVSEIISMISIIGIMALYIVYVRENKKNVIS